MPRRLVCSMVCIAITGLSCGPLFGSPAAIRGPVASLDGFAAAAPMPPPAPPPVLEAASDPSVDAALEYLASRNTGLIREELELLAHTLVAESRRQRFDLALVMAVMHVESRFHNFALSSAGAVGLMQILPSTGEELARREGIPWRGSQTLLDPATNVRLGIAYLRELSDRYRGDLRAALAAYNWGPGHVDRRLQDGTPLPTEYPDLVTQARAQRAIARVAFAPTSSATN